MWGGRVRAANLTVSVVRGRSFFSPLEDIRYLRDHQLLLA